MKTNYRNIIIKNSTNMKQSKLWVKNKNKNKTNAIKTNKAFINQYVHSLKYIYSFKKLVCMNALNTKYCKLKFQIKVEEKIKVH